jgi:trehalose 6-phosphate phosphatase
MANNVGDLPNALTHAEDLEKRLEGGAPAVFLDYDGTLTPIVDRPEDAVISDSMQSAVRELAERCPVCVVSGRDRKVVQDLMGLDNLIVAGSHGFDIWSPDDGKIERDDDADFDELLDEVKSRVSEEVEPIDGASVEPKAASVAIHYRLVSEEEQHRVKEIVDRILEEHPDDLKMTPGKMVYEIQPKIDWDKGKAVVYLLETLELDRDDVVPIYIGDDVTDEDAFGAISDVGIGVFVGGADDPDFAGRTTAADYVLGDVQEVEQFLNGLAR